MPRFRLWNRYARKRMYPLSWKNCNDFSRCCGQAGSGWSAGLSPFSLSLQDEEGGQVISPRGFQQVPAGGPIRVPLGIWRGGRFKLLVGGGGGPRGGGRPPVRGQLFWAGRMGIDGAVQVTAHL